MHYKRCILLFLAKSWLQGSIPAVTRMEAGLQEANHQLPKYLNPHIFEPVGEAGEPSLTCEVHI